MGEVFRALDTRMGRQSPPYIVSELVPGESLRQLVGKGAAPARKAVDIAAQIAAGLAAAHAAGIVHRDLKPENVIVTPEGIAKILDFGVARLDSRTAPAGNGTVTIANTAMGSVVGTAAYMSPEQARAQEGDHRSDQFSLGLVLYETLTGSQAFERPSAVQTMAAIVEDDPPPIERAVAPQLRWILTRCLAKEREGRYESTRDLARELAQLRDHYGELTGTNIGPVQAGESAPGRRRPLWPIGACLLAAAVAWCAAQWLHDPRAIDLSRYHPLPFATALAAQTWPVWSPDGRSIAFFAANADAPAQVYAQAKDAPTAVAITTGDARPYSAYPPFWSADSHSVYFHCDKSGVGGICRAPAGGGATAMVQPKALVATLSPDGRTLAMLMNPAQNGFGLQLLTASPPDAAPRPYEPQPWPKGNFYNKPAIAFAPDGKQILVAVAIEGRGELAYLAKWPAAAARPIFPRGFPFSFTPEVSWMPDARYAVFADSTASFHSRIFMADTEGGKYWPILVQDRGASSPSVSPDGKQPAYLSNLSHADVIAVPLGDGPIRTLLGIFA